MPPSRTYSPPQAETRATGQIQPPAQAENPLSGKPVAPQEIAGISDKEFQMTDYRSLQRPNPPPVPSSKAEWLSDFETLRNDYAAVSAQLAEMFDVCRELSHQNDALEKTALQERAFYQEEIAKLRRERDMLAAFGARLTSRLDSILEVINGAISEANQSAAKATEPVKVTEVVPVGVKPGTVFPIAGKLAAVPAIEPDPELTDIVQRIAKTAPPANRFS